MKARLIVVFFSIAALLGLIVLRAAYLQILPYKKLEHLQSRQFQGVVELLPRRGAIFDRNGVELASSVAAFSLYADPSLLENPKQVAKRLSQRLGVSAQSLYTKIKDKKKKFIWIQRRLEASVKSDISAW